MFIGMRGVLLCCRYPDHWIAGSVHWLCHCWKSVHSLEIPNCQWNWRDCLRGLQSIHRSMSTYLLHPWKVPNTRSCTGGRSLVSLSIKVEPWLHLTLIGFCTATCLSTPPRIFYTNVSQSDNPARGDERTLKRGIKANSHNKSRSSAWRVQVCPFQDTLRDSTFC